MDPTAVVSRNGSLGIEILEFEGSDRIANRDATGFYYTTRPEPGKDKSRLAVLFSGTSFLYTPSSFGLPILGNRDTNFQQFALAAIGEYLDREGVPPYTPGGVQAAKIECFSPQFQSWLERQPASDNEIESYLRARLYWSWRYGHSASIITSHDLLRLRATISVIDRIAQLESGRLWTILERNNVLVSLRPKPEFLREERDQRQAPTIAAATNSSPPAPGAKVESNADSTPSRAEPSVPPSKKQRKPRASRAKANRNPTSVLVFVDEARLADLRAIASPRFDLRRLVAICDELNICYRSQCHIAVGGLIRALLDHVPPIFEAKTFAEVANNYPGGKSFGDAMKLLDGMARKIADGLLHTQIRNKESLPTRAQVDFSSGVDVLLAEVVRKLS